MADTGAESTKIKDTNTNGSIQSIEYTVVPGAHYIYATCG